MIKVAWPLQWLVKFAVIFMTRILRVSVFIRGSQARVRLWVPCCQCVNAIALSQNLERQKLNELFLIRIRNGVFYWANLSNILKVFIKFSLYNKIDFLINYLNYRWIIETMQFNSFNFKYVTKSSYTGKLLNTNSDFWAE